MGFFSGIIDKLTGADKAAKAAEKGAAVTAAGQQEALDYQRAQEAPGQHYRGQAMGGLAQYYGIPGFEGQQFGQSPIGSYADSLQPTNYIDQMRGDPRYLNLRQSGEEAIMRNAAMTGGVRSGNTQEFLADNSQDLLYRMAGDEENKQRLQEAQYLQGLGSFASMPSNAGQIAGQIAGIGQTRGQGEVAKGQALAQGRSQMFGAATGAAGAYMSGGTSLLGGGGGGGGQANFAPQQQQYNMGFNNYGYGQGRF
jgi:hypothetical protein